MTRLESIAKALTQKILKLDKEKQRKIIYQACLSAMEKSQLDESVARDVIISFNENRINMEVDQKIEIEKLIDFYDEQYFKIQENERKNGLIIKEYLSPFYKARALSAVLCCFDKDLGTAAVESVYEAAALYENKSEFLNLIYWLLD
jgi:hypothetical protein